MLSAEALARNRLLVIRVDGIEYLDAKRTPSEIYEVARRGNALLSVRSRASKVAFFALDGRGADGNN